MDPLTRRRSPGWVRALSVRDLHRIAYRLQHQRESADLSDRQEWLWDALISELEYRWRSEERFLFRCTCQLCVAPFPYFDELSDADDASG